MGRSYNGLKRLWRPGGETLEAIAAVLSEHWRAAATLAPSRLFWQTPAHWLKAAPPVSGLTRHHFTRGGKLIR